MRSPGSDCIQRSASKVTSTDPVASCLKDSCICASSTATPAASNSSASRGAPPASARAAPHDGWAEVLAACGGIWAPEPASASKTKRIRNHGLFSKAQRALDIAGWSAEAQEDVEIFRLVDTEGLTPLLMVLNDAHPNAAAPPPEPLRGNGAAFEHAEALAPAAPVSVVPAD